MMNKEMSCGRESAQRFSALRGYGGMVVVLLTILWPMASVHGYTCQKNYFYDHGTGKCEPCSDICYKAKYQKTEDRCARLCPDYNLPDEPAPDVTDGVTSSHLSSPVTAAIASVIVGVALCFIVFVIVSKRQSIAELWRRARCSPADAIPADPEASQSLSVGVQEEGNEGARSLHAVDDTSLHIVQQESENGRFGAQEIALVGSSAGSSLNDENMEPKTFHDSA